MPPRKRTQEHPKASKTTKTAKPSRAPKLVSEANVEPSKPARRSAAARRPTDAPPTPPPPPESPDQPPRHDQPPVAPRSRPRQTKIPQATQPRPPLRTDEWNTPDWLWRSALWAINSYSERPRDEFDLDPCTNNTATVPALRRITATSGVSGLSARWDRDEDELRLWLNPPWFHPLPWIQRARSVWQSRDGVPRRNTFIVGVMRADTSTEAFACLDDAWVLLPRRRIAYVDTTGRNRRAPSVVTLAFLFAHSPGPAMRWARPMEARVIPPVWAPGGLRGRPDSHTAWSDAIRRMVATEATPEGSTT